MRRVLIVEDSAALRRLLAARLEEHGFTVDAAVDAASGAEHALASPPDAIVSDLWMPGLSGLQLCQLLRGDPATAHLPILMWSSRGDRRSRFWAARSGATAFFDKADLAGISEALDRLVPLDSAREPIASRPRPALRPGVIAERLSMMLDRALFMAVVAGELRRLALESGDIDALFSSLTELLSELMDYVWLGLAVQLGEAQRVYVHQSNTQGPEPGAEAMKALGVAPTDVTGGVKVVLDARPAARRLRGSVVVTHAITMRGQALGKLAIELPAMAPSPEEAEVLTLAAREIALPIRAVGLLEESQRLATTDVLTGLANRRQGVEMLERETGRAGRYLHRFGLAIIDVDNFKRVNDTLGHSTGDRVLIHIARILGTAVRKTDMLARWGGEEFLAILTGTSGAGARLAAERIRAAVERSPFVNDDGTTLSLSVSVGLASCVGQTMDALLESADQALYRAKSGGRNRVEVAPDPA